MIKKIGKLTKVLFLDYINNLEIIKNNKINKKSFYYVMIVTVVFALGWLSYELLRILNSYSAPQIFLKIYFLIFGIVIMFQSISTSISVYFFSKDLEYILPLPIKSIELLVAKFNTILGMLYISEIIFMGVPCFIYGCVAATNILYFFWMFIGLIVFPIFSAIISSIIIILIMKLSKFVANKSLFQVCIIIIFVVIFSIMQNYMFNNILNENDENDNYLIKVEENLDKINNKFIFINPVINFLTLSNNYYCFLNFSKIIIIDILLFVLLLYIGKKIFLKNILKNTSYLKFKNKIKNKKYLIKKNKKNISYIKREIKNIIKNPIYLIQGVFPSIILIIVLEFLCINLMPEIMRAIYSSNELSEVISGMEFDIEAASIILFIIQLIYTIPNLALTAISREGKNNIVFLKSLPVNYYEQFLYKNIPQIILNTIISIFFLLIFNFNIYFIKLIDNIIIFIICMFMNFINSYLMVLVDLHKPNLNWDNEISSIKSTENKMYMYFYTVINIAIIYNLVKYIEECNYYLSLIILAIFYGVIFLILDRIIYKKQNKIFNKIF